MAYTTINKHTAHFNTKLYTGDGTATQAITGVGFQPDWTWIKCRNVGHDHYTFDAVRTNKKGLEPSDTSAERTPTLGSFDSDGFTFASSDGFYNGNGDTYVAWNWKANGAGSTNTDGSVDSTVSLNTTAGFSIVKFNVGSSGGNITVGHGLGKVPKVIIIKSLDDTYNWDFYHEDVGNDKRLKLNENDAATSSTFMSDTSPTSSVFTFKQTHYGTNSNAIAFCFNEVVGYSSFSKYIGTGDATNSPFIFTGFKPSLFIVKNITTGGKYWLMFDNKRDTYNQVGQRLYPAVGDVESTGNECSFLSNGIKLHTTGDFYNGSGSEYIYMAFGQSLVGSNNVPCTAR